MTTKSYNSRPLERRAETHILFDVLKAISTEEDGRPTRVMHKANLSWSKLQDSFKKLEAKNLIYIETDESTRRRRIRLTESGIIFVARHKNH